MIDQKKRKIRAKEKLLYGIFMGILTVLWVLLSLSMKDSVKGKCLLFAGLITWGLIASIYITVWKKGRIFVAFMADEELDCPLYPYLEEMPSEKEARAFIVREAERIMKEYENGLSGYIYGKDMFYREDGDHFEVELEDEFKNYTLRWDILKKEA